MAFIELSGVCKGYGREGQRTHVLEDVNLSIEKGELVSIVGYSGAGKTTLVSLLAGLIAPDKGEVRVGGKLVQGPSPERGVGSGGVGTHQGCHTGAGRNRLDPARVVAGTLGG